MANVCIMVPSASLSIGSEAALPAPDKRTHFHIEYSPTVDIHYHVAKAILSLFVFTGRTKDLARGLIVSIARSVIAPFCVLRS